MADAEEKTEQPSAVKLKEARQKGQVLKSADVVALVSLFFSVVLLALILPFCVNKLKTFLSDINKLGLEHLSGALILETIGRAFDLWFLLSMPILLAAGAGAIIGNVSQFGFLFSTYPLMPKLKKLDPVAGAKKLFSKDRLIELIKQLCKFATVMMAIYFTVKASLWNIVLLARLDLSVGLATACDVIVGIVIKVLLCMLLIACFDYFWQRYSFLKSMRMSKYEVKREYKQQEGDPHIKQERRRLQQETLQALAPSSVENAAVVITNPSHVAVAIKFDENQDAVPVVTAKGIGELARRIITEAKRHEIPIVRNVPLARDLLWLDLEEEIPKSLYDSVAEVLTFIHELNDSAEKRGATCK